MSVSQSIVCDLDGIYKPGSFEYSLPRSVLESFLDGKAFDHKASYSQGERERLERDITTIYQAIIANNPVQQRQIVVTAGAPGAGKTWLMRSDLALQGKNIAYIDPDDVCLRNMTETYQRDLREALAALGQRAFASEEDRISEERAIRKELYDKWRPGSNAANHIILALLIREGRAIYFGTTATSPSTGLFFKFLAEQGYFIRLLHVTASDDTRWDSVLERDKEFVQATEEDIREKGVLFPQRLQDTYLRYVRAIEFYRRSTVSQSAQLAATWEGGVLCVLNPSEYEQIQAVHNACCRALQRDDLLWPEALKERARPKTQPSLSQQAPL